MFASLLFSTFPHTTASLNKRFVAVLGDVRRFVAVLGDVWNANYRTPEAVEALTRAFHPEAFR